MRNLKELNLEDVLSDKAQEDDLLEVPLADKVFKFFYVFLFIAAALIIIKLIVLGVFKHSFYSERALANISEIKVEPVPRGIITDRFGKPLVKNEPTLNIFLVPKKLPQDLNEKENTLAKIGEILNIDKSALNKEIEKKDWALNDRLYLTNDLNHDQLVSLSSVQIPGLETEPAFKRAEEIPLKFSHLVGYTGLVDKNDLKNNSSLMINDEVGRSGLEAYYDSYLRGINGKEIYFQNSKGEVEDKSFIEAPVPGHSLETYVDSEFQAYFYDSLQKALDNLGRSVGLGIAMNPQNGEVLALFNIPSFDSKNISDFLNNPNQPLFNRAVSGVYSPGSTIKPLVATGALTDGIVNPSKQIFSAGFIEIPNPYNPENPSRFLDWKAHGWVDLKSAIARSSNIYFYAVGGGFKDQIGLGIQGLKKWWEKFGLNQKTEIDLVGEEKGFLPDPEWKDKNGRTGWRLGDTYNVSIGQGDLLVTPIELLNYINAVANGGKLYKPRIVKDIKNEKGDVVKETTPVILKDLGPEIKSALSEVQAGMHDAVIKEYGTAYLLHDLPMTAAGKTGSSQIENNKKVNAFFVGYAPYENPQIAVLILVENAREGSLNVVPVAKDILMWYAKNRINSK